MIPNLDKLTWKQVSFGDVVRNVNETVRDAEVSDIHRVIAMEHMDPGELKIQRWGSLDDGTTFARRVQPGQTLFGKRRAYQRKVAYAEFDAICSGDILTFEPDKSQMLREFLPFLVQSNGFFDHALGTSAGSLSPRTNWRDLANFQFGLPSLDEQKRIADLLWALERHRHSTAKLAAGNWAVLRALLPGFLFGEAMDEPLKVGDLVMIKHGFAFSGEGFSDDEKFPTVVTPGNFAIGGGFQGSALKTFTGSYSDDWVLKPGDVIVTMTDLSKAGDTLGYSAIVPNDRVYLHNQRIGKVIFKSQDAVLPEFIYWVLRTEDYRQYILRTAAGSTVRHTSPTRIEQYELRIPNMDAQRRALTKIDLLEASGRFLEREVDAINTLRAALLAEIFEDRHEF
jgi:type I restriction enzyme, S subunit